MRDDWINGTAQGTYKVTSSGWTFADLIDSAAATLDVSASGELPHITLVPGSGGLVMRHFAGRWALRNGTLQGAYLIIAARALGLDCGPMSGFNNDKVDAAFFPDGRFKSNFLCCLGYGDPKSLDARYERFAFDEVCKIL